MARTGRRQAGWALTALAAAAMAGWAGPARADPRGQLDVRAGLLRFDYEERDPAGTFLDGEEGFVPSLTIEGELRFERIFTRAMFRLAKGSVSYDGHVQSADPAADGLPVRTTSDATFLQGELQVGGFLDPGERVALFGALGARRWSRDILGTNVVDRNGVPRAISGLSETYSWFELQLGLRWTFLQLPRTSWDLDARVVRTAGAEISVDLSPFGGPSDVTMGLGARTGWRLGTTLRQDVGHGNLFVAASAWAEGYAFGQSDVNQTFQILEPDSSTVNAGFEIGLGGRF